MHQLTEIINIHSCTRVNIGRWGPKLRLSQIFDLNPFF